MSPWSAVLPPAPAGGFTGPVRHDSAAVGAAVRALVAAGNGRLRTLLVSPGSAEALLAAWEHHAPGLDGESCLTVGAAADAAFRAGALPWLEWAQVQADIVAAQGERLAAALEGRRALIELQRLTAEPIVLPADREQELQP